MTVVAAGVVDVHCLRSGNGGTWEVLALRRAINTRCTGAWEIVHGHIETGEQPEDAAVREVREETGLNVLRLYNVTVQPFYLHGMRAVQLAVVFAAIVSDHHPKLGEEHDDFEWLTTEKAYTTLSWPRERASLADAVMLLRTGDAGPVEDVLRVY